MNKPLLFMLTLASLPLSACASDNQGRYGYNRPGYDYEAARHDRNWRRHQRYLAENDMIYRDNDGHYYCKRDDGTAGTIVGALAGGILGNAIAPGGSKALGTILGAGGGAIAGNALSKNSSSCQ